MNDDKKLEALAEEADEYNPPGKSAEDNGSFTKGHEETEVPIKRPLHWQPFPVDLLPEPIAEWTRQTAAAIPCDPSMVALPTLAILASCIGGTRAICLKRGWTEPCILWTAIIAKSGGGKTPAIKAARNPIEIIEREAMKKHREDVARYKRLRSEYEKVKKDDRQGDPPRPPVCERLIVSDTTIEALAPLLKDNPRGLLLYRDEIAGWIEGMGQYKKTKGDDQTRWLEIYGAEALRIDRKTGDARLIYVPRAVVSLMGGIQPGILKRCIGQTERENGLLARILVAWPPEMSKRWSNDSASKELNESVLNILRRLRNLSFDPINDADPQPVNLYLHPDAKKVWADFVNQHGEAVLEIDSEDLRAAYAKLEGVTARIALILHLTAWAAADPVRWPTPGPVSLDALERAIGLTDWFKHETERVYQALHEDEKNQKMRRMCDAIHRLGGRATIRDLMRTLRRDYRGKGAAERAEADLLMLAQAGLGHWVEREAGPEGGRPTCEFVLTDQDEATGQNPAEAVES